MKLLSLVLPLAAAVGASGLRAGAVQGSAASMSPLTRVVELLKGMAARVADEAKQEEDLYETFVCWGKTVISQKTASNGKAASRKDSLETYVADLDAGRVELTSERADLVKEIAGLSADIEQATALREQEAADFAAASGEMAAAIEALKEAVTVLKEGMGKDAGLLSISSKVGSGFRARVAEGENLARAVEVGHQVLSRGDALFLQRILTGEVPVKDWKKLNRKATFKMNYKARSEKILETLQKMLFQFESTLSGTTGKEDKAVEFFDKLMGNKGGQKDAAQAALTDMEKEGATRGLTKTEAMDEIKALGEQITADDGFLLQTESDLKTKKEEWAARKSIRMQEIAAINKAISILHGDDARDLFKKSLSSQGYSFFQVAAGSAARAASVALAKAARAAKDERLSALAGRLATMAPSHFVAVVEAIDSMITVLEAEEKDDLSKKEKCEQDRADDTKDALTHSRGVDEIEDTITRLESEIAELEKEKEEKQKEIVEMSAAYKEALSNRGAENEAFLVAKKDDEDAAVLVQNAVEVLSKFYTDVAAFVQRGAQPDVSAAVQAGKAPPPPPPSWDAGGYTGKQDENTGVIAMLTTIKEDIEKDLSACKATEGEAQGAFDTYEKEYNTDLKNLNGQITTIDGDVSDKDADIGEEDEARNGLSQQLKTVMQKLKDEQPGCDFVTVNYETRLKNRQIEIDGLNKAKAILSGGAFSK